MLFAFVVWWLPLQGLELYLLPKVQVCFPSSYSESVTLILGHNLFEISLKKNWVLSHKKFFWCLTALWNCFIWLWGGAREAGSKVISEKSPIRQFYTKPTQSQEPNQNGAQTECFHMTSLPPYWRPTAAVLVFQTSSVGFEPSVSYIKTFFSSNKFV